MTVKLSSKYQVVIPEPIRNSLGLKPGLQIEVIAKGKVAYLVPVPSLEDLKKDLTGKLKSTEIRDKGNRSL